MAESRRLQPYATPEVADRDSRAEALLVEGLDRYFSGNYEEAIHVWTRVLFLDRSHARARAYIDRARTALAEKQRQAEEMLQATSELLEQGRTVQARDLLSQAVAASGDDERASELRARLERIERAQGLSGRSREAAGARALPARSPRLRPVPKAVIGTACALGALLVAMAAFAPMQDWSWFNAASQPLPAVARSAPQAVLSSSEAALVRARTLYTRGRLAEALQALERVDPDSTNRAEADRLRVEIQQILLATRRRTTPASAETDRGRP